ncbi:hypothetical protein F442_12671 [Phytophthora nicotianae P10297]|uniref:RxLR effector protein n=3 Tax=Phytophthora nicotianae TaxID=4792 RepID=W2PXC5_PHYN3|nr:hypothetical protein PPTG_14307 [Phytophthora nicotianae INRA-310]ETK82078.1 hypothetical protein L915_12474 [Phytophthora nicotianae]ETP39907.1 hypothetical protein F442_12671 [Phytophthora nicotianae P10297]ETL35485.1 hypothetical protein L916_12383 [Phytophthora nicotianae]ETL88716.1 hypothetical protein L917_12227 [Phytophthora nicotianae]ETN05613.1 hypothetical protein PPTG_14307 [Phytophthora nicotianae INRA-310]
MTKFAFFAALLLVIGGINAVDINADELPPFALADERDQFNSTLADGSGQVNTTLEERCCLDMM